MTEIASMIGVILLPGVAVVHPDHIYGEDFGFHHYLTDPFHVGLMAIAVLFFLMVCGSIIRRHSLNRSGRLQPRPSRTAKEER